MILGLLLSFVALLLLGGVLLLPTYTPPGAADLTAFQVIGWLIPLNEIVLLASGMALFAVAGLVFTVVNWSLNKVRGSG
jgi:hypothetical protein